MWWLETCACLFPSYTPSSHHTLHLTLHSPSAQELGATERRGEGGGGNIIPCPTLAPHPAQTAGRQACREYSEGDL